MCRLVYPKKCVGIVSQRLPCHCGADTESMVVDVCLHKFINFIKWCMVVVLFHDVFEDPLFSGAHNGVHVQHMELRA